MPEKMVIPKINLHVHSTYSDGRNTIEQIVKKAIDYELKYIAITDHFTNSWKAKIIPNLDSKVKIDNYLEDISEQQHYLKQKNTNLRLLKGIEIDISSSENYILNLIDPYKFDILLFEYLENPEGIAFIKNVILNWNKLYKSEKKFPILGLAHFDPSFFIYGSLNILISFLKEFNIYFEFNSSYPQYYSVKFRDFFVELGRNNIMVAIGCDSHNLVNLNNIKELVSTIRNYGLINNLFSLINKL
ncbi:MAG: PHP domain-containing protein [Candidatus Hodarchaeota archaeon]